MEADARTQSRSDDAEARLVRYLRDRASEEPFYCKSKYIAEEVGLTPRQVGQLLGKLQGSLDALTIEQWSYTKATTWRVTPDE